MTDTDGRGLEILIVGGGVDGWLTAAVLARALPAARYAIRLIETPGMDQGPGATDGGQASLPLTRALHRHIGLNEAALFQTAAATASLGAEVRDGSRHDAHSFHPFGDFGAALNGVAFHSHWLRLRDQGAVGAFDDYALGAAAARLGRFAPPSDDPGSILSTLDYAYHWDTAAYSALLRARAEAMGVQRLEGQVATARPGERDGFIQSVMLEDGRVLEADLYIDASGPAAVLSGADPRNGFEDWGSWLPCDRVMSVRGAEGDLGAPCLDLRTHAAGWSWRMPLQGGDGHGVVWSSAHMDDETAERMLIQAAGERDGSAHAVAFASGRRSRPWSGNRVAVGAAACVLDPVVPTALELTRRGVQTLLELLPRPACDAGEAAEYNRVMIGAMERMRDFVILRQRAMGRMASPFWSESASQPAPESLSQRMALFDSRGRVRLSVEDVFGLSDWTAAYLGHGMLPRAHDPLADMAPQAWVRERLEAMRRSISAAAQAMPPHAAFIEQRLKGA